MEQKANRLLTEKEARQILPMSLAWFRKKRLQRAGPRFLRISRRIFYRESDLVDFINSQLTCGAEAR
jgi:predicted DNA-binding transcriptional regulator AlpA